MLLRSLDAEMPNLLTHSPRNISTPRLHTLLALVESLAPQQDLQEAGGAGGGAAPAGEDEEAEEANNRRKGIKKNKHTRAKTDARLALLALWFGETPFTSITVLDRLITLLTVCKNAEDMGQDADVDADTDTDAETNADADADADAATDVDCMEEQDDEDDADDEGSLLFSFAHVYEEIVRSAEFTNPDQGGDDADFDPCRVVLCLSTRRRTGYLVQLHPTRLRPVVERFQRLTTPLGMSPVLRLRMRSHGYFLIL